MIHSFTSHPLEVYFKYGDARWIPFGDPVLSEIRDLLIDLHVKDFCVDDLRALYPVIESTERVTVVLTVNGTEQCGAVTFKLLGNDVYEVDLIIHH